MFNFVPTSPQAAATPNRGGPLTPIGSEATSADDEELLRMFDTAASPSSSPRRSLGEPGWQPSEVAHGRSTPPVTPVKLARASLSWGSGSWCSSDSETALWAGGNHTSASLMSPITGQRVMQERLAEVPRAARRLVPGWRDCLATEVQPLAGASGCAFRLRSVANGTVFVRLLRSSVSRDSRLVAVTRTAAAAGLAPAVLGADAAAMVQEWIEGSAPDPQEFCQPVLARRLGWFIAAMHALPDAPTTAETRAASRASATYSQQASSLTCTSVGMSVTFQPAAASTASSSVVPPNTALPSAVFSPLQRNGVDCTEFELAWRAAETFQAEQLARPPLVGVAGALVWTHGDLHLHNLLQVDLSPKSEAASDGSTIGSEKRLFCIDLETVALRPAISDLTNLLRHWRFPELATRRALVEGYISQQIRGKNVVGSGIASTAAAAVFADAKAGPTNGGGQPPEGSLPSGLSDDSVDAMLWAVECSMPTCLTRWIVAVMTAPDAMGGDPSSAPRVRQAMHFVPLLAPAIAALREATAIGAEQKRQRIIELGIWATVGLPPLDQVFGE